MLLVFLAQLHNFALSPDQTYIVCSQLHKTIGPLGN